MRLSAFIGVAMKITAWGMIAIGAILFCFVAGSYLFTTGAADAGPTNPAAGVDEVVSHTYWWAAIPAVVSIIVGVYLLFSRGKGFQETYDPTKQQVIE